MSRKPKCVIVTGRPGAGKTTLAKALGKRLWMPVISRDEIKEGYVNTHGVRHDMLPPDANGLATASFFDIVHRYLEAEISIVIEAAFQHGVWEARLPKIVELADPVMIVCLVDGEIAAKRHLERGLENPEREFFHGDKRVVHFRETGEVLPPDAYVVPVFDIPTIQVATDSEIASINWLVEQIRPIENG